MSSSSSQPSERKPVVSLSPAREGGMERVLIIITDLNGEEIMRTRIYSSLYIRQVKLAISRSKYTTIVNPLECFILLFNGNIVDNTVCIKSLLKGKELVLQLDFDKEMLSKNSSNIDETIPKVSSPVPSQVSAVTSPLSPRQYSKRQEEIGNRVSSFVDRNDLKGCFQWLSTADLDDSRLITAIESARKGFPVNSNGKVLFPLLHSYLHKMCTSLKSPSIITAITLWYRLVIIDLKPTDLNKILSDLQLVLYSYLSEKDVVQSCVHTLLVLTELSFSSEDLEIMSSTEFTYIINNVMKLYPQEVWISSFFQFLQRLVFDTKSSKVELIVSSYHLSLLSPILLTNTQPVVFKAVCSYLESIAASRVPSIVMFNSDFLPILASILQTSKKEDSDNVISIIRVFVAFSLRKELNNLIIESNIASLLIDVINVFSSNRTVVTLVLRLLQNLSSSSEICCYLYLLNILYVLQICLSVYRDSDLKIIHYCYKTMYLLLRNNDAAILYLNETDIELILYYCQYYSKETTFLLTLLQLITVIIQKSEFFAVIRNKRYERIFESLRTENTASGKVINKMIDYILSKEDLNISQGDIVFDFPTKEAVLNTAVNEEQVMRTNKLYYLLIWRLTHSSNIHLLEAASQSLLVPFICKKSIIADSLDYLPSVLYPVFKANSSSLLFNESVITIIYTILSYNPYVPIPREYIPLLLNRIVSNLFSYELVLHSLNIIKILNEKDCSFLKDESVVLSLQRILYATHSIQCREIITSLLQHSPLSIQEFPRRNDNLEDSLYAATIFELSSDVPTVVVEALKICSNAFILSQTQFMNIFTRETGFSRLLEIFRTWENEEILHPALDFLKLLVECKSQGLQETEKLPVVVVLYKVLRRHEKCKECVESAVALVHALSDSSKMIDRVVNNIDLLMKLLATYALSNNGETPSVITVKHITSILSTFAKLNVKGVQILRNKNAASQLSMLLSQIEEHEVSSYCLELFLTMRGEDSLSVPCDYLVTPCIQYLHDKGSSPGDALFQILVIFTKIMEYNRGFVNHPIHQTLLLRLSILPVETILTDWCEIVINYLMRVCTLETQQTLLVSTGLLERTLNYIKELTTIPEDRLIKILFFLSDISTNLSIKSTLRCHLSTLTTLSYDYIESEDNSVVELALIIISNITNANDAVSIHPLLETIQQAYSTHNDIMSLVTGIVRKWRQVEEIGTSNALERACSYLLSSNERDIIANLEIMIHILTAEKVDISIIPQIESISTILLDWISTNDLVGTCPSKVLELLDSIMNLFIRFSSTKLLSNYYSVYCHLFANSFTMIRDSDHYQEFLAQLLSRPSKVSSLYNILSDKLINMIIRSVVNGIDYEATIDFVGDIVVSEDYCIPLINSNVDHCLFSLLSLYNDIKKRQFILAILYHLAQFKSIQRVVTSQSTFTDLLSKLKLQYSRENDMEMSSIVNSVLMRIRSNVSEEEIKNAVVKRYGSIPENVAPECF